MKINKNKFGEIIRKARKKLKKTMSVVGEEVGVTREAIRLYELGSVFPSTEILPKLLKCLNLGEEVLQSCSYDNDVYIVLRKDEFKGKAINIVDARDDLSSMDKLKINIVISDMIEEMYK